MFLTIMTNEWAEELLSYLSSMVSLKKYKYCLISE